MNKIIKATAAAVILGASATSAQAFFGPFNGWGSPWSGSDSFGWGDVDMSLRTTGWGRNSYSPYYAAPYGYPFYGTPAAASVLPVAAAPQGEPK